jgi:hypothetical protein
MVRDKDLAQPASTLINILYKAAQDFANFLVVLVRTQGYTRHHRSTRPEIRPVMRTRFTLAICARGFPSEFARPTRLDQ